MTTRPGAESRARKGALAELQSITTNVRWKGWSHAAKFVADKSGPRKLNFAWVPSDVPWPSKTSQSGAGDCLGSAARVCWSRSRSVRPLVGAWPMRVQWAWAAAPAWSQRCAVVAN